MYIIIINSHGGFQTCFQFRLFKRLYVIRLKNACCKFAIAFIILKGGSRNVISNALISIVGCFMA